MTSFLKAVFAPSLGATGRAPSFNDFSLHVASDTESELDTSVPMATAAVVAEPLHPKRTNVWQETFSPQMNSNMKRLPRNYYDHGNKDGKTVWDHIIQADNIRSAAFHHFDENKDGLIDADDLRARLGMDANVELLIKQADKNKDGKIDQAEFCELLKNM